MATSSSPRGASSPTAKSARLAVRLTPVQDQVVRQAAQSKGEPVSEYVVRHIVEAAQADLADRRVFVVDDAQWTELQARLSAPPAYRPNLAKLLANPPAFEE